MEKIEYINGYNIYTDPIIKYIRKKLNLYDISEDKYLNLIKDILQDIEYFLLEKCLTRANLFVDLYNDNHLFVEFDKFVRQSFKENKPIDFNTIDIESYDIETCLELEKYGVYIDTDDILNKPDSEIRFNNKTKEIEGIDVLKNILSIAEYEAFLLKVRKPAEFKYKFIKDGLTNTGIDNLLKQAVIKIKIFQEKEKFKKERKKKADRIAKKIAKPVDKLKEWRKRREQRKNEK